MLTGTQRKFLRGRAHPLKPVVIIGQNGLTDSVVKSTDSALTTHELIKVKFIAAKEKEEKKNLIAAIEARTGAEMVGRIGHTAIFYRQQPDPDKRTITLPQ
jgi:RNA-binding protein